MKIIGLITTTDDAEVGKVLETDTADNAKVKEIKYFESSQVYNKFLHEPLFVIELEDSTKRVLVPSRSVEAIIIETRKDDVKPEIKELG